MPTPPLPIPSTVYTGKTISELRSLSSTGTLGLLGNLILAKINGLNPNPGAWFKYKNERYKVWKAKISSGVGSQGLTIDNNLTVACKDKSISILEIQKEGKSKQTIDQFLLGNKISMGEKII